MATTILDFDSFTLRDKEVMQLCDERPTCGGTWLAVQARSVSMPPGEVHPVREFDGEPVEMAAIIAAQWIASKGWIWVQLSPPTKEVVGDYLFEQQVELDRWYYLLLSSPAPTPPATP